MTAPSTPENVSLHLRDLRGKPHAEVVIIKRDTEGSWCVRDGVRQFAVGVAVEIRGGSAIFDPLTERLTSAR